MNPLSRTWLAVTIWTAALAGCNPYEPLDDESVSLGAVDPVNFPAANLGTGGDRTKPGLGTLAETPAYVAGQVVGYFSYAVPAGAATVDPLRVLDDGKPYAPVATPTAYVFDATDANPVPETNACKPPPGYRPNARLDAVNYRQQGNVFTALPTATYTLGVAATSRYVPVVAEAPLSSERFTCQQLKSDKGLEKALPKLPGTDGKYLAWLIIEPAASVYPFDDPSGMNSDGLGLQKWGWYKRYLLAYLDGGYIPTHEEMVTEGTAAMPVVKRVLRMLPQKLYVPRSMVIRTSMGMMTMAAGRVGAGYDVLEARRGQPGYSPLCEVITYDAGMPLPPDMLPKDAKEITDRFGPVAMNLQPATPRFVYCLQVR
jgi:hypothetical protein